MPPGVAAAAESDPTLDAAHDAGRSGVPYEQFASDNNIDGPRPPAPRARRGPDRVRRSGRARSSKPTLADPTGGRLPITFDGEGLAGFFFGAVFYALGFSVIEYGPSGPLLWLKAKFLNQPAPAPSKS
jgi:hypothetical protein